MRIVSQYLTAGLMGAVSFWAGEARASDWIIKSDSNHLSHQLELEPHGVVGLFLPPGDADGLGAGVGLRAAIPLAQEGFIKGVNDSVAIGFGLDWMHYGGGGATAGTCAEYAGTGSSRICTRVTGTGGPSQYFLVPAVMQWNFFLTRKWSVFGEPGLGLFFQARDLDDSLNVGIFPIFQAGGRYHFSDNFTLTVRLGYPYASVGVSLLF